MARTIHVKQLGPLAVGQSLGAGRIAALIRGGDGLLVEVAVDGAVLAFSLAATALQPGPFPGLPALSYRRTAQPFATVAPIGHALAAALAPHWPAVTAAPDWTEVVDALGDDPRAAVALADLLPAERLTAPRCVAPWTRLEYGFRDRYGPCCADFQTAPALGHGPPLALWASPALRGFRRALTTPTPSTCRPSCPRWLGRSDDLRALILRGGPAAFRANQVAAVRAILAGDEQPTSTPLELVVPATSYCNYDCLMCSHGAEGSLTDELPPAFYQALAPLWPGLGRLEVLGGEPLASPVFREFLAGPVWRAHPQLEVALTTNGSYLTPDALDRYRDVAFAHVTISLNAATAATYAAVNRGLPWARIRGHLDALWARRAERGDPAAITYSFVILRANRHELEAFTALALADGAAVRFMLPVGDRNRASILTDRAAMADTSAALGAIAAELRRRGRDHEARRVDGERAVLTDRLTRGVVRALPIAGE
jgi:molybdenum cofactor biosynthesis enzyme MoaA